MDHLLLMIFWAYHFFIFLGSGQFCHYYLQARALFTSLILAQRMVLLIQSHHTLFHARGVLIMYDILYAFIIQIVESEESLDCSLLVQLLLILYNHSEAVVS